jgi:ribose/xylose/arabinose/galactoside ABC-type transport system permease subunit
VLIFGMLKTGLVLAGMDERMFKGVVGVIMIFAVVLNNMTKRSRR